MNIAMDLKNRLGKYAAFLLGCSLLALMNNAHAYIQNYSYDANNNVVSRQLATDQAVAYDYDVMNRLSRITLSNDETIQYEYDAAGRLTKMVDPHGLTEYFYDSEGRLIILEREGLGLIYYYYDKLGRIKAQYDSGDKLNLYEYKPDGQLYWTGDTSTGFNYYAYDSATGLLIKHYRLDGNGHVTGRTEYGYDDAYRITLTRHHNAAGAVRAIYQYQYDANSNPIQITRMLPGETEVADYGYDELNRLIEVIYRQGEHTGQFERFEYDAAGNMLTRITVEGTEQFNYGGDNRLLSVEGPDGQIDLHYDEAGRLIEKIGRGQRHEYSYDDFNRLTHWNNGEQQVTYHYDGRGQLIERIVNGESIRYLNDNSTGLSRVLLEIGQNGNVLRRYNYGYELSSQTDPTGTYYPYYDKPGRSVVSLRSGDGQTVARYKYSAFGVPEADADSSVESAYQYTGERYDEESQLLYLRSRFYDPTLARFISRDSFGGFSERPASLNRYSYVENNPTSVTDPTGESGPPGACFNLAVDFVYSVVTGSEYTWTDAALSIAGGLTGAAYATKFIKGAGIVNKAFKASKAVTKGGRGQQVGSMIKTDGSTTASAIKSKAESVGFKPTQTANGPLKMVDENGVARVTIKGGSQRAPGSAGPHVELKTSSGQRVNPGGNPVTRKSPENHTPIDFDL